MDHLYHAIVKIKECNHKIKMQQKIKNTVYTTSYLAISPENLNALASRAVLATEKGGVSMHTTSLIDMEARSRLSGKTKAFFTL